MDEAPEKSEMVKLADHYYIVAESLSTAARRQLRMAEALSEIADNLCERSIREDNHEQTP